MTGRVIGVIVPSQPIGDVEFAGGAGRSFAPAPPVRSDRCLDATAIRRRLARPVRTSDSFLLDQLNDPSGSVYGTNDVVGLRFEATLIAIEHLAAGNGRRGGWSLRMRSFDSSSPLDMPVTRLDRNGVADARERLLIKPQGYSSELGPSLSATEADPHPRRLLVVHSDFELFDPDVDGVLDELIGSNAVHVLALVYRSQPPARLANTRVEVRHIHPSTSEPADIARYIVDAANTTIDRAAALAREADDSAGPGGDDETTIVPFQPRQDRP